jgi:hypothetical protein
MTHLKRKLIQTMQVQVKMRDVLPDPDDPGRLARNAFRLLGLKKEKWTRWMAM